MDSHSCVVKNSEKKVKKIHISDWPVGGGRKTPGDPLSPVAVVTCATLNMEFDMSRIAISGSCVTENAGMEKVIETLITNPNIRFLIVCGRDSHGHNVAQAFSALKQKGIDDEHRIIGATGTMPYLKNLTLEQVERFRSQIEVVNLSNETDTEKIMHTVDECIDHDPGAFDGKEPKSMQNNSIMASPNETFLSDPKGHFIIYPFGNDIVVEHYDSKNKMDAKIIGKNAEEICHTIARLGLIGEFEQSTEHACYLGRELQKAEIALKSGIRYEQDSEIAIKSDNMTQDKQDKKEVKDKNQEKDEYGWYD